MRFLSAFLIFFSGCCNDSEPEPIADPNPSWYSIAVFPRNPRTIVYTGPESVYAPMFMSDILEHEEIPYEFYGRGSFLHSDASSWDYYLAVPKNFVEIARASIQKYPKLQGYLSPESRDLQIERDPEPWTTIVGSRKHTMFTGDPPPPDYSLQPTDR